jgi:probable addiction module antidote protein
MGQMPAKTAVWDSAELLRDKEDIAAYLDAALEEAFETNDPAAFNRALGVVARSQGVRRIAQETGHGRESLYKSLSPEGNPGFATVLAVLQSIGIRLSALPAANSREGTPQVQFPGS